MASITGEAECIEALINSTHVNISELPSIASSASSSTSGCLSGDISLCESSQMPVGLRSRQLIVSPDASLKTVLEAIEKCKELVLSCDQWSDERKWLVRYLVELRYRAQELQDPEDAPTVLIFPIAGHHFQNQPHVNTNVRQYCDHCSGVIWSVVQGSYKCQDCGSICHSKCIAKVSRVCAHVLSTEGRLTTAICPQKGLAAQLYKCAECQSDLSFKGSSSRWSEPRLCDYSGLYFCTTCHWNNTIEIPARIVHNWDWDKQSVSQSAYQLLVLTKKRPLINLEEVNNKLFGFVAELDFVRKMRGDLKLMHRYLVACQDGRLLVTGDLLHMVETSNLYSVGDLEMARDGLLVSHLSKLVEKFRSHIMECAVCYGKGYLCELCRNDEVIFPFDSGSIDCEKCNSLFHRVCWTKNLKVCPKCKRIERRSQVLVPPPTPGDPIEEAAARSDNEDEWMPVV